MNGVGFKQLVCWVQLRLVLPSVVVRGRTACDICVSSDTCVSDTCVSHATCVSGMQLGRRVVPV